MLSCIKSNGLGTAHDKVIHQIKAHKCNTFTQCQYISITLTPFMYFFISSLFLNLCSIFLHGKIPVKVHSEFD